MFSLDRLMKHHRSFGKSAVIFYIRRAFRIYPLAMVSVTIVTLLGVPYITPMAQEVEGTYLANLFLIFNLTSKPESYGVLWTLPIELQMYLFLPFCFLLAKRSVRLALLLGVLSISVGVLASTTATIKSQMMFWTALYAPCFASGILAYALTVHYSNLRKIRGAYWAIALLAVVAIAELILRPQGVSNIVNDWITSVSIALLIPFFKDMDTSWLSEMSHQIAKYSYGIYLFHLPIMTLTNNDWFDTTILVGVASVVAYHVIELPFIKLSKKITAKEPGGTESLLAIPGP